KRRASIPSACTATCNSRLRCTELWPKCATSKPPVHAPRRAGGAVLSLLATWSTSSEPRAFAAPGALLRPDDVDNRPVPDLRRTRAAERQLTPPGKAQLAASAAGTAIRARLRRGGGAQDQRAERLFRRGPALHRRSCAAHVANREDIRLGSACRLPSSVRGRGRRGEARGGI